MRRGVPGRCAMMAVGMVAAALGSNACCHTFMLLRSVGFLSGRRVAGSWVRLRDPPPEVKPLEAASVPGELSYG